MNAKNPEVDTYLIDGCGRCPLYLTPQCKVHSWVKELRELRRIVLGCGLNEEFKWSQPCYTFQGNNILLVTAFKDYACLAFFKGVLLKDPNELLTAPGENSQAVRQFRFDNVKDVVEMEDRIKSFVFEAIALEEAGVKVEFKKNKEPMPEELLNKFK